LSELSKISLRAFADDMRQSFPCVPHFCEISFCDELILWILEQKFILLRCGHAHLPLKKLTARPFVEPLCLKLQTACPSRTEPL
jgi:hypothetical protein